MATNPHFIWDSWGFLLILGDPTSWRDAIGRLMEYLYAHGKFHEKNEALDSCLDLVHGKYVLYRHPTFMLRNDHPEGVINPDPTLYQYDKEGEEFASRDHWSYFIQYYKNTRTDAEFTDFISKVPRMRGMNLWMKTLTGSKWHQWWFYTIFNFGALLGNVVSNLITWIGRLGPEESIHWWIELDKSSKYMNDVYKKAPGGVPFNLSNNGTEMQKELTRWQKRWQRIWVVLTPFYPIQNRGWQLKWLPPSKRKERQKRILLRRTDRGNLIVRALFGDTHISELELQKYPETTGDASGVKLNKSCDRVIEKIHNTENCYKKKLAWKLHNENIK